MLVTAGLITTALALTASALVEGSGSREQGGRHPSPSHAQNSDPRQLGPLRSRCWPTLGGGCGGVGRSRKAALELPALSNPHARRL